MGLLNADVNTQNAINFNFIQLISPISKVFPRVWGLLIRIAPARDVRADPIPPIWGVRLAYARLNTWSEKIIPVFFRCGTK